jgi:acetolactate synthase-1/2/3 large subunit
MGKIKVADYIINKFADIGVDKAFVVYGAANGDLIDAFTRTNKISYVAVMHEQAGGFASEVYTKVKNKVGLNIATSGPGGMNFVTPIGNCYYDSIPSVFITGQINSQFLRSDESIRQVGFQETDIVSIVKPITKYATMIAHEDDVPYEVEKAIYLANEGRPGPVLLDIPLNIQKKEIDVEKLHSFNAADWELKFNLELVEKKIDRFLEDLENSKKPVLMIGGGLHTADALDEFYELTELLKIPTFPTWNALDIVTSDLDVYGGRIGTYGGSGRNFGIQNSDLLLGIGTRISGRITGGNIHTFAREAKKYVVDIDPTLLQKKLQQVPFDENIHCDAKLFIQLLNKKLMLKKNSYNFDEWLNQALDWKNKYDPVKKEFFNKRDFIHPYAFVRTLSHLMQPTDVLVGDCGGNIVTVGHAFESKKGQRMITNNGNSPMGFSFAASMGSWFADKTRNTICITGDGGMNMNIQELQTFKNYGVNVKVFILNNHIYGITKAYQKTNFQGRAEACGPKGYNPPDFIKIAQAYGIKTKYLENNLTIEEDIKAVLAEDECIICDVNCHEFHTYEPRIFGWKTPIEDMYPYLPRDEFKKNLSIEPIDGWENPAMPDIV